MSSIDFLQKETQNLSEEYLPFENILSTIIGLAIGFFIGYILFKKYIYHGPNSKDIVNKTYTDDNGKKYRLEPVVVICPSYYSMQKLKK